MRLTKRSYPRAALGLTRSLILKLWYARCLEIGKRVLVDRGVSLFLIDNATARLGDRVHLDREVELQVRGGSVLIGPGTGLNAFSRIVAFERIEIGARCAIGQFVSILDHDHTYGTDGRLVGYVTQPIRIGDDVWIGDKATILKGVTIGNGAIVAAGAVVAKDVPAGSVVAGVPARIVRSRGMDQD